MREQVGGVPNHQIEAIVGRSVELFALSVAAIVKRDDAAPGLGEGLDPARTHPVHAIVGGEAVNEQDRLVQVAPLWLGVDEGDVDASGRKTPELAAAELFVRHGRSGLFDK